MLRALDCQLAAFLRANAVSRNGPIIAALMFIRREGYTWQHEGAYWYLRKDADPDSYCAYITNNFIWYTLPNRMVPGYSGDFPNSKSSTSITFDLTNSDAIVETVNTALNA